MIRAINGFLPNSILINAVANFYQSTAPTTRIDGSALVIGDLWKKAGQEQAEWDGTNWISPFKYLSANGITGSSNATFLPLLIPGLVTSDTSAANIKIIYQRFFTSLAGGTLDATNNWSIEPRYSVYTGNQFVTASPFVYNSAPHQSGKYQSLLSNYTIPSTIVSSVLIGLTRNNAPSNGVFSHQVCYAHILG